MPDESRSAAPIAGRSTTQVYALAAICLVLGLALGYLFRGSRAQSAPVTVSGGPPPASPPPAANVSGAHPMPTLDQMKQMADTKAEPLLAQLKSDPSNRERLIQVAKIYEAAHQFKQAATYYQKSLEINPKDEATRTQMATCLYYDGDADGAIAQLQLVLQVDPKDANSLFNLGMIRWKGKNDGNGAIAAWQRLLNSNPQLEDAKKAQVQKLMAEASQPAAAK